MGFGDRFKDLKQQAQEKVAENRDKIQEAIETAGVVANAKSHGRHANRIMNATQRAGAALDKFGAGAAAEGDMDASPSVAERQDTATASAPQPAESTATPIAADGPRFADEDEPATTSGSSGAGTTQPTGGWGPAGDGPKFDD